MKQRMIVLVVLSVLLAAWSVIARDFADRTPKIDRDELAASVPPPEPQEPPTLEERMAAMEAQVDRLYRITDPFEHRDEMRLERRVRELEEQVERLTRDLRRLEQR